MVPFITTVRTGRGSRPGSCPTIRLSADKRARRSCACRDLSGFGTAARRALDSTMKVAIDARSEPGTTGGVAPFVKNQVYLLGRLSDGE